MSKVEIEGVANGSSLQESSVFEGKRGREKRETPWTPPGINLLEMNVERS